MSKLRTLIALGVAILATLALTTTAASATVVDQNGDPYTGPISGEGYVNASGAPTGGWYSQVALTGEITDSGDSGGPTQGTIDLHDFSGCYAYVVHCTVDDTGGPYEFEIASAPAWPYENRLTITDPVTFDWHSSQAGIYPEQPYTYLAQLEGYFSESGLFVEDETDDSYQGYFAGNSYIQVNATIEGSNGVALSFEP